MMLLAPSTAIVLAVCCLLTTVSFAFQTPFLPPSHLKLQQQVRHDTSLNMGLRTFIKTKLGRGGKEDSSKNGESSEKPSTKSTKKKKSKTAATEVAVTKPKGITIPKEPITAKESVTEKAEVSVNKDSRLPRIRTESVKDRLNRVRSGQMTEDEKQAFLRTALSGGDSSTSRKPLRQELPDDSRDSRRRPNGNATPYPKDSLLTNMARGWGSPQNNTRSGDIPLRSWKDGAQLEDQKKKREYFEMVTNPNRFHTYKSSMVTQPGETDLVDPEVHDGLVIPQMGDEKKPEEVVPKVTEDDVLQDIKEYEQTVQLTGDLGSRLEQAAHALEEAAKKRELERKEKEEQLKKQRLEERARLVEIQRKQQLEMEKRELELKAKKREEEEAMAREMERRRKEEAARLRELQKAQDAYWAKKLLAEKQARLQGMTESQRAAFAKHEAEAEAKALELEAREAEALEAVQEAVIDIAAADYITKESMKGQDSYDVVRERKRREAELARDEQLARLKELNSPLPAPSSRAPPTASPFVPPASFAQLAASELSSLAPAPAPPAKIPKAEPTVAEMMAEVDDDEVVEVESSAGSGFLSRVLIGKKQENPAAAPEPKRVVRQKLPLEDEEVEFDTFDRSSPNRKISIADAMRASGESIPGGDQEQRSKMWGVDMSRIAKSLEDEKK